MATFFSYPLSLFQICEIFSCPGGVCVCMGMDTVDYHIILNLVILVCNVVDLYSFPEPAMCLEWFLFSTVTKTGMEGFC